MCEIENDHPYIYLLEFHIGDGYFDRQSVGEYSVIINYRKHTSVLIKEKERGDDRLVKFRQGKSIIFGITKPNDELKVIFEAFDNNEEIGESSIYFLGIGAPKVLALKSLHQPTASVIRSNLQLSHDAGSLQVFARLTCFGFNLLTDFCTSNQKNTEFDSYVSDIELSADECFTRCQFEIGDVKDVKDFIDENRCNDDNKLNTLCNMMSEIQIHNDIQLTVDPSLCYYEASLILQDESDEYLKQTMDSKYEDTIKETLNDLIDKAVYEQIDNCRPIKNLDDLMFTNFIAPEEYMIQDNELIHLDQYSAFNKTGINISSFVNLSADNSVLDLKDYEHLNLMPDNMEKLFDEKKTIDELCVEPKIGELCVEPKIGDAPLLACNNQNEEIEVKKLNNTDNNDDEKKTDDIPYETGDGPIELLNDDDKINFTQGWKRRKQNQGFNKNCHCTEQQINEQQQIDDDDEDIDICDDEDEVVDCGVQDGDVERVDNEEILKKVQLQQCSTTNMQQQHQQQPQQQQQQHGDNIKRKVTKGKRRGNNNKK